jgi:pro-kumamolisin-like protein/Big-like domain-containing protein
MRHSRSALLYSSASFTPTLSALTLGIVLLCTVLVSSRTFASAPDRILEPIDSGQTVALAAGVPHKAQPQYDQGPTDPSYKLSYMELYTAPSPSQQIAISHLLAQQQDSTSPLYHQWLTPEQYADRFSLSVNDVQKITLWLTSQGFAVVKVARSRNLIAFSGTTAQAEQVFHVQIHNFNIDGEKHISNTTPPAIPAALVGIVSGVGGLSDFRAKPYFHRRSPNYSYPIPNTSEFLPYLAPGDIEAIYNITPLYTASTPIIGTNQKLVVVGQTDVYLADLNNFRSGFGFSSINCTTDASTDIITACSDPHFQYVLNGPDVGVSAGDLTEADIDLEWSGAIAYDAQIIFVNSGGTSNGVWDAWHTAVTDDLAPVITMSYGICELGEAEGGVGSNFSTDEPLLQQAALQGITFMNSSGDTGAAACDSGPPGNGTPVPPYSPAVGGLSLNFPASSPEVTGVGGTMIPIADLSDPGKYWTASTAANGSSVICATSGACVPENGWNDDQEFGYYCASTDDPNSCFPTGKGQVEITSPATFQEDFWIGSSTGGPSNCYTINGSGICDGGFPQPTWQQNLDIPGQTTTAHVTPGVAAVRFSPDISLLASADFPGYIVCTAQSEVGGTSSASSCVGGGAAGITTSISTYGSIFGGTSFSSPIFAGIVTLLNQYLGSGNPGLGSINAQLYSLAKNAPTAFNQVTAGDSYAAGSNIVYDCEGGTPTGFPLADMCLSASGPAGGHTMGYLAASADPTTGYNLVTGLGSVNVNNLFQAWVGAETASSVTVQASAGQILLGQSVTLTATVLPATATGQVSFFVNGAPNALGTATVTASSGGVATFTTIGLPVGTDNVTASFFGSGYNTASTTATAAVVNVTAPSFTWATSSTSHTVLAGQTTQTYSFTATPTGGATTFAGPVTFSCSFSPADTTLTNANCAFTPSFIAGSNANGTTAVSMTITTAGPNTGTGAQLRRRADNRSPWLPLTLPVAGVVMLGLMRGKLNKRASKRSAIALMCFSLALLGFMMACGGGGSSTTTPPPASVSVSPNTKQLYADEAGNMWSASATQQQFSATVSNSTSQTVTWSVAAAADGSIGASSGLYTAPATVPSPAAVTITATSSAATSPGTSTVTIVNPTGNGQLPATYTVTVTATEATTVHTQPVTLVVQ